MMSVTGDSGGTGKSEFSGGGCEVFGWMGGRKGRERDLVLRNPRLGYEICEGNHSVVVLLPAS